MLLALWITPGSLPNARGADSVAANLAFDAASAFDLRTFAYLTPRATEVWVGHADSWRTCIAGYAFRMPPDTRWNGRLVFRTQLLRQVGATYLLPAAHLDAFVLDQDPLTQGPEIWNAGPSARVERALTTAMAEGPVEVAIDLTGMSGATEAGSGWLVIRLQTSEPQDTVGHQNSSYVLGAWATLSAAEESLPFPEPGPTLEVVDLSRPCGVTATEPLVLSFAVGAGLPPQARLQVLTFETLTRSVARTAFNPPGFLHELRSAGQLLASVSRSYGPGADRGIPPDVVYTNTLAVRDFPRLADLLPGSSLQLTTTIRSGDYTNNVAAVRLVSTWMVPETAPQEAPELRIRTIPWIEAELTPGRWVLEASPDAPGTGWTGLVTTNVAAPNGATLSYIDAHAAPRRFYRLRLETP